MRNRRSLLLKISAQLFLEASLAENYCKDSLQLYNYMFLFLYNLVFYIKREVILSFRDMAWNLKLEIIKGQEVVIATIV